METITHIPTNSNSKTSYNLEVIGGLGNSLIIA